MAANKGTDKNAAAAPSGPVGGPAAPDGPLPEIPGLLRRLATPGTGIALVLAVVFVYFAWGMAFEPGGTGSNVVLGLLMAGALLYLITANLGPLIDQALFHGGSPRKAELTRELIHAIEDFDRAAARAAKGKERGVDEEGAHRLGEETVRLKALYARVVVEKDAERAEHLLTEGLQAANTVADKVFGKGRGGFLSQLRSLTVAFAIALALRAFIVEPFQIPSGSMIPTLLVGDHLFVARFMYGISLPFVEKPRYLVRWGTPQPGDVVVFVAPEYVGTNAGEDWIKRVIAGPGQHVRIEDNVLIVDDVPYAHVGTGELEAYEDYEEQTRRWKEERAYHQREHIPTSSGGEVVHSIYLSSQLKRSWPVGREPLNGLECGERDCQVKEGHIFVMGDNRDNSNDGRRWGAVPIDHVKGKALFIWMSVDGSERSLDVGRFTLPRFRWERLFQSIE